MKTVDAHSWKLEQYFQLASIVILTQEPVELHCNKPAAVVEVLTQLSVLGLHVTTTDKGLLFSSTKQPFVRELTLIVPETISSTSVIGGLLPLLLFSNTQLQFTLQGKTHAPNEHSICWYHELVFRYVRKYLDTYSIGVTKASMDSDGRIDLKVASKQALSKVIPELMISQQFQLSHIIVELIAKTENELEFQEKLLRLAFAKFKVPTRFITRIAPFYSFTQLAFFGSKEGYDNDSAFLQGYSHVQRLPLEQKNQLDLLRVFEKKLLSPVLGEVETLLLLPVLALVGGSLPVEATRSEFVAYLTFLSEYLVIDFYTSEDLLETEGYARLHCPEVVDVDDL